MVTRETSRCSFFCFSLPKASLSPGPRWLAYCFVVLIWSPLLSETYSFYPWRFLSMVLTLWRYTFPLFDFGIFASLKLQKSRGFCLFLYSCARSTKNFWNLSENELHLFVWDTDNKWIVSWMAGGHTDRLKYLIHGTRELNSWVKLGS